VVRAGAIATIVTAALVLGGSTQAASQPSERACLIVWNSPANHANRVRLLAERPIVALTLRAGVAYTDTWTKGSPPTSTGGPACLMSIAKRGEVLTVTGLWKGTGVPHWAFGPTYRTADRLLANVRLLPDGRVTKIYRR
jgi:hypothetical protein